MPALPKHHPPRMTLAEFLDWEPGDGAGRRWQLIDGEPVAMAPASQPHGAIQAELIRLIGNHLVDTRSACRVIGAPGIVPRIHANENHRIPDLGVTCSPETAGLVMPDPVLLVEILSPGNEAITRANIWSYTTIPSVLEILAVHSTKIEAELFRRQADGAWPENPEILRTDAVLRLSSIDFAVPLHVLYRTTPLAAGEGKAAAPRS
jgi:Uma2 family endonuclease